MKRREAVKEMLAASKLACSFLTFANATGGLTTQQKNELLRSAFFQIDRINDIRQQLKEAEREARRRRRLEKF